MKKLISISIMLALVLAITACAPGTSTTVQTTKSGTTTIAGTTIATTAGTTTAAPRRTITSLHSENTALVDKPKIVLEACERLNIDWKPTVVGSADLITKLNALIAAKTVPDIFSFGISDGVKYRDNGLIIDMTALLNKYGADIKANRQAYLSGGLNSDGKLWGIPTPPGYPMMICIRTDWLKNLNLSVPTDTESFYNVMKAFTKDDPNKNGKADTLGLTILMDGFGTFEGIFSAFGFSNSAPIILNKTVTSYIKHPNFLKSIEYLRRLYNEGLMEPDFVSIPQMKAWEKLWTGVTGATCWSPVGPLNNWLARYTETVKPEMTAIILSGPDSKATVYNRLSSSYYGISSTCKYPEEAMRLANYFSTPAGDELLYLGVKGVHFDWDDQASGKFHYLDPYKTDIALQRADGGFMMWATFRRINDNTEIKTLTKATQASLKLAVDNPMATGAIVKKPAIETELGTTLADIEKECVASLIVSKGDIKSELAAFITKWDKEGGATWEKQATEIYKQENP
jgi:putative aldouronate transport system substrate-binding protein